MKVLYPEPGSLRLAQERACKALYICGQCGKTQQGENIRLHPGRRIFYDMSLGLPSFGCECGGLMKPLEFETANAKLQGQSRATPEAKEKEIAKPEGSLGNVSPGIVG